MKNFKSNQFLGLFNPNQNNYFPVRILKRIHSGYRVLVLENKEEIDIYDYQIETYGYHTIWPTEKLMSQIGFKKENLKYSYKNVIVYECILGNSEKINYLIPLHRHYYSSTVHLGFTILDKSESNEFINDCNKIDFKATSYEIKKKYCFINSIDDILSHLIYKFPKEYNYEIFDKLILDTKT